MGLSKRLAKILSLVTSGASLVCDVGSDHGYLSIALIKEKNVKHVIASDISANSLNKTILKSKTNDLLIEFPPMKGIDIVHILQVAKVNAKDFFKRV